MLNVVGMATFVKGGDDETTHQLTADKVNQFTGSIEPFMFC